MSTEAVLINGRAYDFSSCRLEVFGEKIVGFTSIDYNDKLERGEGRGASQVLLAVTRGKYAADPVKIELHKSTGAELRAKIASQSRTGKSLGSVVGTIILQVIDDELGVQTTTMGRCQVNVPGSGSFKEGSDPLMESWEFFCRTIDRDGITLYESDEPGAEA